jgi:hypothetical protein
MPVILWVEVIDGKEVVGLSGGAGLDRSGGSGGKDNPEIPGFERNDQPLVSGWSGWFGLYNRLR